MSDSTITSSMRDRIETVPDSINSLFENIRSVIYMERIKLEYLLASKVAGGHVILADSHGVGKTSLARALAGSIIWEEETIAAEQIAMDPFSRIQSTVDLLPQDIIGYTRLSGAENEVVFNKGPIFAHFVLCDEINLLTPKTQGSFFQAMEEQMVSIEGRTWPLPAPFFIIATMNLKGAHLFPLPAPQLDRFMIQLSLGFPSEEDEAAIVRQHGRSDGWRDFKPVTPSTTLLEWQAMVDEVSINEDVIDYIVALVRATRSHPEVAIPASPRTGVKLSRLARSLCLLRGRDYVSLDTIKEIFIPTVAHRLTLHDPDRPKESVLTEVLASVPVDPRRRSGPRA
jgi:MoxR-like ATPase